MVHTTGVGSDKHHDEPARPGGATSTFWSIVHEADWSRVGHAYGTATDTPQTVNTFRGFGSFGGFVQGGTPTHCAPS